MNCVTMGPILFGEVLLSEIHVFCIFPGVEEDV
jgi:hypothetical protein